jgi:TonB family protein
MPEVSFTVTLAGGIHSLRISKSSGHPDLDEAALAAIRHSAPFAPPPFGKETEITMSLNFEKRTPENSG